MKEFAKKFYNSKSWHKCRESYIANRTLVDGGMCEVCKKRAGLIVHHKIILTPDNIGDPNVSLNHDNLRYECKECHDYEADHFYDAHGIKKPNAVFDSSGQPIAIRNIDSPH